MIWTPYSFVFIIKNDELMTARNNYISDKIMDRARTRMPYHYVIYHSLA